MLIVIFYLALSTLSRLCSCDDTFTSGSTVGSPHALKIPFCRRGHGQMNAMYIDESTGERKRGILIFGGDGINYEQPGPGSSFLRDLWILSIDDKKATSDRMEAGDYTHSWTRIVEESTSANAGNVDSLSTPTLWPGGRWNFGYTVTERGWFLLYGGENAADNVHYDDTWVFYENHWLELKAFNSPQTGLGPGQRKGASLLLLPLSGLVMLWGGQRPPVGGGKRQTKIAADSGGRKESRVVADFYSDDVDDKVIDGGFKTSPSLEKPTSRINIKGKEEEEHKEIEENEGVKVMKKEYEGIEVEGVEVEGSSVESEEDKTEAEIALWEERRRGRGRGRGPYVQCLSDTYIFNATAALRDAAATSTKKPDSPSTDHLQLDTWRRVADFPGDCLCGVEAIGIVDPLDSREKLFAFGGRYRAGFSAVKDDSNSNLRFLLADDIWLYDPLTDVWTKIIKNASTNWPEGRDKHAMVFVSELNTVFVSGGRLADPPSPVGDDRGQIDVVDMDLWGYDLMTRKWSQYGDPSVSDDDGGSQVDAAVSYGLADNISDYIMKNDDNENISDDGDDVTDISDEGDESTKAVNTRGTPGVRAVGGVITTRNMELTSAREEDQKNQRNNNINNNNNNGESRGNRDQGSNDANSNNKWWVGVAGDLPAARYQHGLSVWRGVDGTLKPSLVCFGGERSDTPWELQGVQRENVEYSLRGEGFQGDSEVAGREKVSTNDNRNVDTSMSISNPSIGPFGGPLGMMWEWAVDLSSNIVGAGAGRHLREDHPVYAETVPSADQTAIDDDSFSGTGGGNENDGGILGPVSSHAQSNDLWLLPLPTDQSPAIRSGQFWSGEEEIDETKEAKEAEKEKENEEKSSLNGIKGIKMITNENDIEAMRRDINLDIRSNADGYDGYDESDGLHGSEGSVSHLSSGLSGGGDSGNHNRNGNTGGRGRGNPRRHKQPPRTTNNSTNMNRNSTYGNHSINWNQNNTLDGDDDNGKRVGWTLLSAGGCHYLDDGSQNKSSVDISALAIVGSFLLAVLFGLLCYKILRTCIAPVVDSSLISSSFTPSFHFSSLTNLSKPLDIATLLAYVPASVVPISVGARIRGYTDLSDESFPVPGSLETQGSIETKFGSDYEEENKRVLELRRLELDSK